VILVGVLLAAAGLALVRIQCVGHRPVPISEEDRTAQKGTDARLDVAHLDLAAGSFRRFYRVNYLPSRFKLCENVNAYYNPATALPATQLDADSIQFLQMMFPRMALNYIPPPGTPNQYDWNNDGIFDPQAQWILEGDQCLIFFLGGLQQQASADHPAACVGFSTNPLAPTNRAVSNPSGTSAATIDNTRLPDRIRPFYEFEGSRLTLLPHPAMKTPDRDHQAPFLSYLDPWRKQPYLYFSSYKTSNGYNRYFRFEFPAAKLSDCHSAGVWPYASALGPKARFYRDDSFQLVCAGPDGRFGPGSRVESYTPEAGFGGAPWPDVPAGTPTEQAPAPGVWLPAKGALIYPPGSAGADDLTNFYAAPMGTPGRNP
jgi:hypothetical protein